MFKHNPIKRSLACGLAITAACFPAVAQAMPIGPTDASAGGYAFHAVMPETQRSNVSHASPTALGPTDASSGGYVLAPSATPTTAQTGSSFHWDDAGIGAAGAVVLLGSAALGAGVTRRRRRAVLS
jgi:hypothetical protein